MTTGCSSRQCRRHPSNSFSEALVRYQEQEDSPHSGTWSGYRRIKVRFRVLLLVVVSVGFPKAVCSYLKVQWFVAGVHF